MAITPLKKNKNHQSNQNPSKTLARKFFSEVLDEACEKEQNRNIEIRTNGYTKDALPFAILLICGNIVRITANK